MADRNNKKNKSKNPSESGKSGRSMRNKKKKRGDTEAPEDLSSRSKKGAKKASKPKKTSKEPKNGSKDQKKSNQKCEKSKDSKKKYKAEKSKETKGPAPSVMVRTVMPSPDRTVMPATVMPTYSPDMVRTVMPIPPDVIVKEKEMSPEALKCADAFLAQLEALTEEQLNNEWEQINAVSLANYANSEMLGPLSDPTVPCLEATRIKVENNKTDFYHCNKFTFEKDEREWIIAQPPMEAGRETFWRLVFQTQPPMIVMIGACVDSAGASCGDFYPLTKDAYKYFGTMYVNNKKVESDKGLTTYSLEVLPEGCSNSHVTRFVSVAGWDKSDMNQTTTCLNVIQLMGGKLGTGPMMAVSASGTGRSCLLAAIYVLGSRILSGTFTNVFDFVIGMRKQRARAVPDKAHYAFIYAGIAQFLKMKTKEKRKWEQALNIMKDIHNVS